MTSRKKVSGTQQERPLDSNQPVLTAGEILPGHRFLELVYDPDDDCRPRLLYFTGTKTRVGHSLRIDRQVFKPVRTTAIELGATRIPGSWMPKARKPEELFSLVLSPISRALRLEDAHNARLSLFCISTWLSDALPLAPPLLITGPDPLEGLSVLRLLNAFCRRPLLLSGATATAFTSLSPLFHTLLVFRPELGPKSLENQLQASNYASLYTQGREGMHQLCRPKAVFVVDDAARGELFNGECLRLALDGRSPYSGLKERRIEEIASELQSQLLAYRLANWSKVHDSDVPMPEYHPAVRNIASALAACMAGSQKLKDRVVSLLADENMDARGRQSTDPRLAIVESLLACVHAGDKKVPMKNLAAKVNVLVRERGDLNEYSAMEIGWKLRDLSLIPRRTAAGRVLLLDSDAIRRIHDLGRSLRVTDFQPPKTNCAWCKQGKPVVNATVM